MMNKWESEEEARCFTDTNNSSVRMIVEGTFALLIFLCLLAWSSATRVVKNTLGTFQQAHTPFSGSADEGEIISKT
jgi:hypothetical protein